MASFTCPSFSANYSYASTCSGVVKYPFYLSNTETLNDLETQVRLLVKGSSVSLGNPCTSMIKNLACAQVYRPCVDPVTFGSNPNTGLPYVQPCQTYCTKAYTSGTGCDGSTLSQANYLGYKTASCSNATIFAPDSAGCNSLSYIGPKNYTVSQPYEPYLGKTCAGLRDASSYIYILDSYVVSPLLAPLLPKYVLQTIIESELASGLAQVPHSFSSGCLNKQTQLFCAANLPTAGFTTIAAIAKTVAVPRFPRHADCLDYKEQCAALLGAAGPTSDLNVNCSAIQKSGTLVVHLYPNSTQVVASLLGVFPVTAEAFDVTTMSSPGIETECPNGFSLMADPSGKGQVVVTDACAMNCPAPIFTKEEQHIEFTAQLVFAWLNTFFIVIQLVHMFTKRPENRNVFMVINFAATLIYMFYDSIQRSIVAPHPKKLTCASDTEWYVMDGDTADYRGGEYGQFARSCQVFSALYLYMEFIFFATVLCVLAEMWTRVHMPSFDLTQYRVVYGGAALVWALGNGFLVNFYDHSVFLHTGSAALECKYQLENAYTDVYAHYVPFLIVWGFVFVFGGHTAVTLLRQYSSDHSEFVKTWAANYTVALYLLIFLIVYAPICIWHYVYIIGIESPETVDSTTEWTKCIFGLFTTSASQSTVDATCGTLPEFTVAPAAVLFYTFLPMLYNFLVMLVTHDRDTWHFWTHFGATRLLDGPDESGKQNAAADNTGKLEDEDDNERL